MAKAGLIARSRLRYSRPGRLSMFSMTALAEGASSLHRTLDIVMPSR
jgi:hypothetical protein